MENYILRSYSVEIELIRGADYPAFYRRGTGANAAVEGKLKFSKVLLNVPVVTLKRYLPT